VSVNGDELIPARSGLTSWMVRRSRAIGCRCTTKTAPAVWFLLGRYGLISVTALVLDFCRQTYYYHYY